MHEKCSRNEFNNLSFLEQKVKSSWVFTKFFNDFLSKFIRLLWTLIRHSSDSRSSDMVVFSHVLTLLNVLNDLSTVQVVAGTVSKVIDP